MSKKLENLELKLLEIIENKFNIYETRILNIENKMNNIIKSVSDLSLIVSNNKNNIDEISFINNNVSNIYFGPVDFIKVYGEDKIKAVLESRNIKSEILLFKDYFLNDSKNKCVQLYGKKGLQIYTKNGWEMDEKCIKTAQIYLDSLIKSFMRVNQFDKYINCATDFMENQTHIVEMKENKYQLMFIEKLLALFE